MRELEEQTRINDGVDLGKDRLPVGQMTGDAINERRRTEWKDQQRATEHLILANDCQMLTHIMAAICLPYHLCLCGTVY